MEIKWKPLYIGLYRAESVWGMSGLLGLRRVI